MVQLNQQFGRSMITKSLRIQVVQWKGNGGGAFFSFWIPAHHNLKTVIVVELGYKEKVREDTKSWDIKRRAIEDTKNWDIRRRTIEDTKNWDIRRRTIEDTKSWDIKRRTIEDTKSWIIRRRAIEDTKSWDIRRRLERILRVGI